MLNICQSCFQRCDIEFKDDSFDYAGTHCTGGVGGTHHQESEVSGCCGESVREVDEDLVDWHDSLKRLAISHGVEWMSNDDPEQHREGFDNNLETEEELAKLIELWT